MPMRFNRYAFMHAKKLLGERRAVADGRDAWSEHQPSAEEENEFIRRNGFDEYAKWHLGVDDEHPSHTKGRYKFPYGDFAKVHRCALLAAESRAGRFKYLEIERAAHLLHRQLDTMTGAARVGARARPAPRSAASRLR